MNIYKNLSLDDFITKLKDYYGNWYYKGTRTINKHVEPEIRSYVEQFIDNTKLNDLKRYIFLCHHIRNGAPGISDIRYAIDMAVKNGFGSDVRKSQIQNTNEKFIPPTIEEQLETEEILKTGLCKKLFEKINQNKLKIT